MSPQEQQNFIVYSCGLLKEHLLLIILLLGVVVLVMTRARDDPCSWSSDSGTQRSSVRTLTDAQRSSVMGVFLDSQMHSANIDQRIPRPWESGPMWWTHIGRKRWPAGSCTSHARSTSWRRWTVRWGALPVVWTCKEMLEKKSWAFSFSFCF